jgi:hypothetical protein
VKRLLLGLLTLLIACAPQNANGLSVTLAPGQYSVGQRDVVLEVEREGRPFETRALMIEGNMTHAGMGTVTGSVVSLGGGRYRVKNFDFNMSGDWILTVSATENGKTLTGEVKLGVSQSP